MKLIRTTTILAALLGVVVLALMTYGIASWLTSIPLMYILFAYQYRADFIYLPNTWFPLYLFMTLFIFSTCSLWYYNRE